MEVPVSQKPSGPNSLRFARHSSIQALRLGNSNTRTTARFPPKWWHFFRNQFADFLWTHDVCAFSDNVLEVVETLISLRGNKELSTEFRTRLINLSSRKGMIQTDCTPDKNRARSDRAAPHPKPTELKCQRMLELSVIYFPGNRTSIAKNNFLMISTRNRPSEGLEYLYPHSRNLTFAQ